ncbi:MAG: fused MFS/spermidine synthase [Proteobacteria bacterium]|nr:fused MFS/spermidine synthase [Pseudomonadota bacterium]
MKNLQVIGPYVVTIFLSALLVFWLEPLYSKMLLPAFGGAPTVWIAALMFFQAVLLVGYVYSHIIIKIKGSLRQGFIHLAFAASAFYFLPPAVTDANIAAIAEAPLWTVLEMLVVGIAVPIIVLSATAPLVQHWFSLSGHKNAHDPYFLYAASNAGSLGALLAFPLLFEPVMTISQQSDIWSVIFIAAILLLFLCSFLVRKGKSPAAGFARGRDADKAGTFESRDKAWVIMLAAVPASLLSGVSLAITTDIAAVPLLWVVPLMVYLGTFILAFAGIKVLPGNSLRTSIGIIMIPASFLILFGPGFFTSSGLNTYAMIGLLLLVQFTLSLACHQELYRRRPYIGHLTKYYVAIAIGGLAGGFFNAVVAPQVFSGVAELPIALVLALILSQQSDEIITLAKKPIVKTGLVTALVFMLTLGVIDYFSGDIGAANVLAALCIAAFIVTPYPKVQAALLGLVFFAGNILLNNEDRLLQKRSFFGVIEVVDFEEGQLRRMKHGTTNHGVQSLVEENVLAPLAYYGSASPAADIFRTFEKELLGKTIGVIGLGAGSLACYRTPTQRWVFYEIDPAVVRIATDPNYFTFLSGCAPDADILVGDGRLNIISGDERFDLIILDAFTSDSIPVHLLTIEAFRDYLLHLKEGGLILVHITNRHLDLSLLFGAIARDLGLFAAFGESAYKRTVGEEPSNWVVMARGEDQLAPLFEPDRDFPWRRLGARDGVKSWTDDFSNILTFIRW